MINTSQQNKYIARFHNFQLKNLEFGNSHIKSPPPQPHLTTQLQIQKFKRTNFTKDDYTLTDEILGSKSFAAKRSLFAALRATERSYKQQFWEDDEEPKWVLESLISSSK